MPKTNLGNALSIGADSLSVPKVNFKVNQYAVLFSSIASELRARGTVKADPSQEAKLRERGLLDDEWSRRINEFAKANKADFVSSKLFSKVGLLEILEPFAGKIGTSEFESKARSRMEYEYNMSDEEIEAAMRVLSKEKLDSLIDTPEFSRILMETNVYRRKMEADWHRSAKENVSRIWDLVGRNEIQAQSTGKGKTLTVLVMPPSSRVQRIADKGTNDVTYCLSIPGKSTEFKSAYTNGAILNALVNDVMIQASPALTAAQREQQSAYVRFIADKNTGISSIKGTSIFDYPTYQENTDLMARMYPAYLAYKYRTVPHDVAVQGITAEIQRDKAGLARIQNLAEKDRMSAYRLDDLSAESIAGLFRGRYMGASSFSTLNLDEVGRRVYVQPIQDIKRKNPQEREERIH